MQDLLAGLDLFRLEVRRTVGLEVVEKVLVVDHETARVAHPPGGQVGPPVDPPQHRAVPQVEVGDRVGGVAPVLLEVEVPFKDEILSNLKNDARLFFLINILCWLEFIASS